MVSRIKASKTLFITVEGEPRVGSNVGRYWLRDGNVTEMMYSKFLDLSIDTAIMEQHWHKTDSPVYLFIRAWYKMPSKRSLKERYHSSLLANTRTSLTSVVEVVTNAIVGKVVSRNPLIAAIDVKKLYSEREPRLEIFVGIPSDWEEVENDLSYAEEKSEELEELQE